MKIAVFGGTGRVGQKVIKLALTEGFEVKALVRDVQKASLQLKGTELIDGNARNKADIERTLQGCDLVFSSLNTDKTDTLSVAIPYLVESMIKENVTRIITIGTAGILNSRLEEGKYRFESKESKRTTTFAAEEHLKVLQTLQKSDLDWTIICPTYLPDGAIEREPRWEIDYLPAGGKKITVDDTALFAFNEIKNPRFSRKRVGISY